MTDPLKRLGKAKIQVITESDDLEPGGDVRFQLEWSTFPQARSEECQMEAWDARDNVWSEMVKLRGMSGIH